MGSWTQIVEEVSNQTKALTSLLFEVHQPEGGKGPQGRQDDGEIGIKD